MKPIVLCTTFIILTACSNQKESAVIPATDSTQHEISEFTLTSPDTSLYVGPMYAFKETSEFYTPLYTLEDVEFDFEKLSEQADSIVYVDETNETQRRRLPMNIAKQYFNLSRLERVAVYKKNGDLIVDAVLVRVELHDDVIESGFVAVFKPMIPSWFTTDVAYCTTSLPDAFASIDVTHEEFNDHDLTTSLYHRFKIDSTKVWAKQHVRFLENKNIYSVIATNTGSYLIETIGTESTVLHEIKDDYSMEGILPISIAMNGKPMLLASMAVNDTDSFWTSLLVYTSNGYEVMSGGRVKVK